MVSSTRPRPRSRAASAEEIAGALVRPGCPQAAVKLSYGELVAYVVLPTGQDIDDLRPCACLRTQTCRLLTRQQQHRALKAG